MVLMIVAVSQDTKRQEFFIYLFIYFKKKVLKWKWILILDYIFRLLELYRSYQ